MNFRINCNEINIKNFHRVPVKFRMQEPDVVSQGGVEVPAVTETTIVPEDNPKMVGKFRSNLELPYKNLS